MRVRLLTPAAGLWCSQRYGALRERGIPCAFCCRASG